MNEKVSRIYLLPFLITLFMTTVAIIQPGYGATDRTESSIANQIGFGSAYLIATAIILLNTHRFRVVLYRALPFWILVTFVIMSMLWSSFPEKALVSFGHQLGMGLVAICTVPYLRNHPVAFARIVLIYVVLYMTVTLAISILRPDIGVMAVSYWSQNSNIRWQGVAGHPNSLGQVCMFGIWVAILPLFIKNRFKYWSVLSLVGAGLSSFVLYKTNSVTAMIVSAFIFCLFLLYVFYDSERRSTTLLRYLFLLVVSLFLMISLYLFFPDIFSIDYLLSRLGRDRGLTGRLSLWDMGVQGFQEKPLLGWGFDGLRSFLTQYDMGYGQLHNGYLDILVRGGIVGTTFVFVIIVQALKNGISFRDRSSDTNLNVVCLIWTLSTMVYSFSESSLARNSSLVWLLFLLSYFYLLNASRVQATS